MIDRDELVTSVQALKKVAKKTKISSLQNKCRKLIQEVRPRAERSATTFS